jgi:hypothetical protein
MKKTFFAIGILLLVAPGVFSQSDIEKKIKQDLWVNCPKEFKSTAIPDKWKNESAVVLAFHREYIGDFTTKVTGLANVSRFYIEKLNFHYRIKVLDKAAVTDFSDISFNSKTIKSNLFGRASTYRVIGIKVIKPDGTEKEVDLTKAVKADVTSDKELKIPIPNLETGDIIDYFIALRDESPNMPDFGDELLMETKYPVVSNTVSFSIPHQFTLHSNSYNGAPSFTKEQKDRDVIYTLKDEMREKSPDLIWHAPLLSAPHIRYRITNTTIQPNVQAEAKNMLSSITYNPSDIGMMVDFIDGNFKKTKDQNLLIKEMFYLLRNPIYMKAYYNIELGDPLGESSSPNRFFLLADKYLNKYKINHDLIMAPMRDYGPWKNLVNMDACEFFIKIHANPSVYIPRPGPFTLLNEIPYAFEGTDGVSEFTNDIKLASTTPEQNATVTKLQVTLNPEDDAQLNVKREILAKGHNKRVHQYLIFTNYDYMKAYDLPKYQVQSSGLMKGILKEFNKEKTKYEQRLTQDYHERDERIKKEIEGEMDVKVIDYKNLNIKNIGMWDTAPDTEYSDEYTIENLTKKVGKNLLLDIGKLIESQTEIKDEQKKRSRPVHMAYARSFANEITFNIPAGYKVEGIENLNMKAENETGGFISTASLSGSTLTVKTRKYYNRNNYSAEEWPKLLPFLEAANTFFTSKVLLKKI